MRKINELRPEEPDRNFFGLFAELCSSEQCLCNVEGHFFIHDGPGPHLLTAIRLSFEVASISLGAQNDDTIEIKVSSCFDDPPDHEIRDLNEQMPWKVALGRPLIWAWKMINQQGYFDGLQLEFGETSGVASTRIQMLVVGSEFKVG